MKTEEIWFTWEDHRRSRELSKAFGVEYVPLLYDKPRFLRYPFLLFLTIYKLYSFRPKLIFCQNPSIVLTSLLIFLKRIFGFKVIVDRHSNFKFEYEKSKKIKWRIFWFLSRWTVRNADLTIVTNSELMDICENWGGRSMVLPDKLPDMSLCKENVVSYVNKSKKINVMAVTTFDSDEPIDEILKAAALLGDNYVLYMTGRCDRYLKSNSSNGSIPNNLIFTGFIPEEQYRLLMSEVDVVVVLTKKDLILNCGAYEAISLNVPLVLSNTKSIKSYFRKGPVFVEIDPISIKNGIVEAVEKSNFIKLELSLLKAELSDSWFHQFSKIENFLHQS